MKQPVQITIPSGALLSNYLHESMECDELNQDIVTVVLSNGCRVEAGWFPENDPNGSFVVTAYAKDGEALVESELQTVAEVVLHIQTVSDLLNRKRIVRQQSAGSEIAQTYEV